MGFTICATDESVKSLDVSFWNWRPTAELIASFGLIDDERLELMQIQCCGAQVTADEAMTIADRIERDILSTLPDDGRVKLDLSFTTEPDDGRFHKGADVHQNYTATAAWLREFVAFCRECRGFCVL